MHYTQIKILDLANKTNIATLKLREIGEMVGEPHPQKIKHHLSQLLKKGFLRINKEKTLITPINNTTADDLFISLPILGSANCGEALIFGEQHLEGYLQVSKSVIQNYQPDEMFVVKAVGNSMSKADINGKTLEDGDYAVVTKKDSSSFSGKYVLSIINGMANIKKLIEDGPNEQIVLVSESSVDYSPIYIHKKDFENYLINGEVTQVIKKPNRSG